MPTASHYFRTLDCAHKLRLRVLLHSDLTEAHLADLTRELSELGRPGELCIERFSALVPGARDLGELRAEGLFASGAVHGRELQVTFGKLGSESSPEALDDFLEALGATALGPLAAYDRTASHAPPPH